MEKIDTSPEEEAAKDEARQFMSDVLPTSGPEASSTTGNDADNGVSIMKAWKSKYASLSTCSDGETNNDQQEFWSLYDPTCTSIWRMVYDEADSNETLEETIEIVTNLIRHNGMAEMKDHCFGVIHTLESLEIEGIWFLTGPDPEKLFGANDETSWFTFEQLGPDANDLVKKAVGSIMMPSDKTLNGKSIKDTQIYC